MNPHRRPGYRAPIAPCQLRVNPHFGMSFSTIEVWRNRGEGKIARGPERTSAVAQTGAAHPTGDETSRRSWLTGRPRTRHASRGGAGLIGRSIELALQTD